MASVVCSLKIGLHRFGRSYVRLPIVAGVVGADLEGLAEMRRSFTHKGITARSWAKPVALEKGKGGRLRG